MRKILCAANHYDDGKEHTHMPRNISSGFVVCGRRHHNCIHSFALMVGFPYSEESLELMRTEEQGFLTTDDYFVTREEAMLIAREANQFVEEVSDKAKQLYSENVW